MFVFLDFNQEINIRIPGGKVDRERCRVGDWQIILGLFFIGLRRPPYGWRVFFVSRVCKFGSTLVFREYG